MVRELTRKSVHKCPAAMIAHRMKSSPVPKMRRFFIFGHPFSLALATGAAIFLTGERTRLVSASLSDGYDDAREGDARRRAGIHTGTRDSGRYES